MNKPIFKNDKFMTLPIFFLLIYIIFTFFPLIYTYMPIFGTIKIVLLGGIGLLLTYLMTANAYRNDGVWKNATFFAWVGFISVMVLSLLISRDRGLTLQIIEVNARYFIVFAIMIKVIDSTKRLELIMGIFAACGAGMGISTIINHMVFKQTFMDSYRGIAVESGLFGDPNDLAMLLNVALPLLLYFAFKTKQKIIPVIGINVVVLAIMLSYSRGGFLGLCAVALGFLILKGRKKKSLIFITLAAAIIFWTIAPGDYKERISTIRDESRVDEETGEYSGRLQTWIELIPEGMKQPLLGVGAGCSLYMAGVSLRDWHQVHNSFLRVFLEMGLLGFFFYILLFALPFRHYCSFIGRRIDNIRVDVERFQFILLSFAAFTVTAFFLPQSYSPILYFISGLVVIQSEIGSRFEHI